METMILPGGGLGSSYCLSPSQKADIAKRDVHLVEAAKRKELAEEIARGERRRAGLE